LNGWGELQEQSSCVQPHVVPSAIDQLRTSWPRILFSLQLLKNNPRCFNKHTFLLRSIVNHVLQTPYHNNFCDYISLGSVGKPDTLCRNGKQATHCTDDAPTITQCDASMFFCAFSARNEFATQCTHQAARMDVPTAFSRAREARSDRVA
jgi:hypothetical protein